MTSLRDALAVRDAVEDERILFPRRRIMAALAGVGFVSKSVWLWGPRRSGKSTVARRLARKSATDGLQVEICDATSVTTFDAFMEWALMRLDGPRSPPHRGTRFRELGQAPGPPVLFVVDEADHLAAELDQDAQHLLRSTVENGRFRYVFVTHRNPFRLVEEFSDVASRLLGVTTVQCIAQCTKSDVEEFFDGLAKSLVMPGLERAAEFVWTQVGGHAIAVTMLAHAIVIGGSANDPDLSEAFDDRRRELCEHLATLWRDLSPETRTLLLDPSRLDDAACRGDATNDGFVVRRTILFPELLREVSLARPARPATGFCWDLYFTLGEFVSEINLTLKSRARDGRGWFWATDEVRRGRSAIQLSRTSREFDDLVNHLSKLLYEAAREADPDARSGADPMRWRIPEPHREIYARHPGIRALRVLRNYADHDADARREPGERNEKHAEAGRVLERLCQRTRPATEADWERAHRALLVELHDALRALLESVRTPHCAG